uniref:Carboxylic ester hydrolase n=1 Tax=Strongyloides venezuelensis TaxID=75913 RepID=A0A0K0EYI7_STRVS
MVKWLLLYLTTLVFFLSYAKKKPEEKIIKTNYGSVKGRSFSYYNNTITEYLGIPFAKPPVGNLRFRPPKELDIPAWNGTFNAHIMANSCSAEVFMTNFTGYDFWNPTNTISEDCLQLNMWVPEKKHGGVLVYIYGGAFYSGSASLDVYNGSVLAAMTNTIVVNLNYRLGVLGFAFLANSDIPGNMGLLDQQMGMKWVYENIEYFGGDKKRITIWGESAGSVSVTSHLYAPGSHKYFNRIISNSGVVDSIWGKFTPKYMEQATRNVAHKLGCNVTDNIRAIVKCLTKAEINDVVTAGSEVQASSPLVFGFVFSPIELDYSFYKGNVTSKIRSNDMKRDIDLFIGKTSNEFTYFMPIYFSGKKYGCNYDTKYSASSKKNACIINKKNYDNIFKKVAKQIGLKKSVRNSLKKKFLKYKNNYRDAASKFLSEVYFECDILNFTTKASRVIDGNVFYYKFSVVSSANPWPKWMGAMHGYELEYEFGMPFRRPNMYKKKMLEKEKKFSKHFMELIGNFVNTGIPSPKWVKFFPHTRIGMYLQLQKDFSYLLNKQRMFTKTCQKLGPYIPRRMA